MKTKKQIRKDFKDSVFERDKGKCKICKNEAQDAHHITDRTAMPYGGYVLENGIALCGTCHFNAEEFHSSNGNSWKEGMHPNDLYRLIGSSQELAIEKSKKLLSLRDHLKFK